MLFVLPLVESDIVSFANLNAFYFQETFPKRTCAKSFSLLQIIHVAPCTETLSKRNFRIHYQNVFSYMLKAELYEQYSDDELKNAHVTRVMVFTDNGYR